MAYTWRHFPRLSKQGSALYRYGFSSWTCRDVMRINFATESRFSVSKNISDMHNFRSVDTQTILKRLPEANLSLNNKSGLRTIKTSASFRAQEPWMISDYEVNSMIAAEETSGEIKDGIIQRYESNQLGSNNPIEDRKFIAKLIHEDGGYLFGILDGHGGDACARSVCQRMSNYIALGLMRPEVLTELNSLPKLVEYICMSSNEYHDYNYIDNPVCHNNFHEYYQYLLENNNNNNYRIPTITTKQKTRGIHAQAEELQDGNLVHKVNALTNAYTMLDEDISKEAMQLDGQGKVDEHLFHAANAGACALVVHINGTELCIANTGDCRAVLGVQNLDNSWSAIQLTSDHTAGNPEEVERIVSQHPLEEATTCIQYERLLKRLAPFRAFGDVRFKWDTETQERIYKQFPGIPYFTEKENFHTPPYLTAEPEVTTYQLQRTDKFLVLATDGLWDMLSNEEVVQFVMEHMNKRDSPPVDKQAYQITFNEQELPCELSNSASCLIREALGGDDHVAVSSSLSIPYPDTRLYRDDMTVIVVFFDWDQLDISSESEDIRGM